MFTPPRHFAIPACPPHPSSSSSSSSSTLRPTILYRGAIPDTRNIPFLRRLKLKTILVLSPKVPKETEVVHDDRPVPAPSGGTGKKAGNGDGAMEGGGDNMVQKQRTRLTPIGRLKRREGVDVRWVKVDKMGEEKLGMSKGDVGEVLKTILDTSLYPLYIADLDGKSHTSLIIACLRKLQGWHMESIIRELERFEPEYEEYPFQSFITSFLTGSSSEPLSLPPPPYPPWLWPSLPNPNSPAPPAASTSVKAASTSTTPTSTTPHSGLNGMGPLRTAREPSAPSAAGSEIAPATAFGATVSAPASAAPSRAGTMKDRDGQMRMSARGNEPNTGGSGSSTGGSGVHTRETSGASVASSLASDDTNTSGSRGFGNSALSDMNQPARAGPTASSSSASIPSNAPAAAPQVPAPTKTRDRERDRERTTSANTALNSNPSQGESVLPFPHPQHARRHPTMKLIFPAVALPAAPPASGSGQLSGGSVSGSGNEPGTGPGSRGVGAMSPLSRTNSRWDERREKERDRVRDKDKDKAKAGEAGKVREKNQARDSASMSTATSVRPSPATSTASHSPTTAPVSTHGASTGHSPVQSHGLLAAATSIVTSGLDNLTRVISPSSREADPSESSGLSGSVAEDSSGRSIGQSGIDEQKSSVPPPRQDRTIDAVDPDATPRLPRSVSFRRQSSFSAPSSPGRNRSSALPRETAESSTMTGSPGSRISQSAQPQPHYGDGSRNADTVDLSRSPPERSSPSGSIDVPSPGSDDEKAGQGGRNELNGDARPTREPSVEYDEDLDDYSDEYDEDEEEEEEDEDEEDDEEVAPTALHISALDLAGYG